MSDTTNTIKVKPWGADQGDYVLINESDFNAEVHELFEPAAKQAGAESNQPSLDALSADELKAMATEKGLSFRANASKAALIELLTAS